MPASFFAPRSIADIAAALAAADEHVELPAPRLHPRIASLVAQDVGVTAAAIDAVLDERAYIDRGTLRLWPWYPEESEPNAAALADRLGLALPAEHLDEPFEPAHYLARSGRAAVAAWLGERGVDLAAAMIDRVPVPPRAREQVFEGGLRAPPPTAQAIRKLRSTVQLFEYVTTDEHRAEVERRLDADLARACARFAGEPDPVAPATEEIAAIPEFLDEPRPVGQVGGVFALPRGALLVTDGALVAIDRSGRFAGAWRRPIGDVFARGDFVFVNFEHVLDLASGEWRSGALQPLIEQVGLAALPSTYGERTAPAASACGRYLLDVDESPFITRIADGMMVADHTTLERCLAEPKPAKGLLDPDALEVGTAVELDGVRFVMRPGDAAVADGRSLAFALAGRWRFLVGNVVRENTKVIAKLGVRVLGGAFTADAGELWVLAADHAIRVELGATPTVAAICELAPVLREAQRALEAAC